MSLGTEVKNYYVATSQSGGWDALLNKGEDYFNQDSTTSGRTRNYGNYFADISTVKNEIPKNCYITEFGGYVQFRQSRSNTSLYHSQCYLYLYLSGSQKASQKTGDIGNGYTGVYAAVYNNAVTSSQINSASNLYLNVQGYYKGTLSVTQYVRWLEFTINYRPILTDSISLNKTSLTLYTNGTKTSTLTATQTASEGTVTTSGVTWKSSNTSVATVSSSGVVTAVANGTATITATASDGSGKTKTCSVTVKTSVTGVTLNKSSVSIEKGNTTTLTATVSPSNASNKNVSWSSSNTSVATVSSGTITAVSAGTATITVTTSDGSKTATCSVTVTEPVVTGTNIKLGSTDISKVYLGTTEISHCYLGTTQIF